MNTQTVQVKNGRIPKDVNTATYRSRVEMYIDLPGSLWAWPPLN